MNFNSLKFIGSVIPEDSDELCKEIYFKGPKSAQKYFLGDEVDGTDGLIIKLTVYYERGIDDFAEVATVQSQTKERSPWINVLMRNCDFNRLVVMGGGGFA